jgi:uncharacterized protein YbjT (DUF2867 family)
MNVTRTALISGATGLVGYQLLQLLLTGNTYQQIISIGRRPLPVEHPKLIQKIVDFDNLDSYREDLKADSVFCCLGTTIKKAGTKDNFSRVDFSYVTRLASITSAQGARDFLVVSSMGADANSSVFYNKIKGRMEEALQQIPFHAIHIFRPSLLLGNRNESRPGEEAARLIMPLFSFLMIGPLRKYRPIKDITVACAMIKAANQQKSGINIYTSDEIERLGANHLKPRPGR